FGPCLGRSLWPLHVEVDDLDDAHLVLGGPPEAPAGKPRLPDGTPPPPPARRGQARRAASRAGPQR
ncbi:MAG TPA: hypothetical protein VFS00_17060, partial [Polyangiaceae bacterium]|nr:hypothetical protein [Polyangiaceae bacterium]